MLSFFATAFGFVWDIVQYFIGRSQRQIGKEQQQNADAHELNKALEAELDAANNHTDALERLHRGDF